MIIKTISRVSEAEMEIMKIVWEKSPITSNEIQKKLSCSKHWKITTILTLANRLKEKGLLSSYKKGRAHYYFPILSEVEYKNSQSRTFLDDFYGGSIKSFIATFYESNDFDVQELKEIKKWFLDRWS